jgi:hypothetical protein
VKLSKLCPFRIIHNATKLIENENRSRHIIYRILIGLGLECLIEHLGRQNALGNDDFQDRRDRVREGNLRIAKAVILILRRGGHGFLSLIWWMPIRTQATGMAVITIPSFLLGLHVFVSCIQRVESARHDHEGQAPKQHRHFCLLSVSAEQRHHCVGDIFPSLQILRDPSITLRNCSVRVRNVGLAGPGQLGVFLCLFPIALCSLRPAFHFNPPLFCTL